MSAVAVCISHGGMSCTVQDTADQYLRDRRLPPIMQAVIGGKFAQQIICRGLPYRSEREEEFYQVPLICSCRCAAASNMLVCQFVQLICMAMCS